MLFPATRACTRYLSGCRPTTSRVLTPMDPVEPSMVRFFNGLIITSSAESGTQLLYPFGNPFLLVDSSPCGRRGGLLQGSFYEVSLALVGVASPAYFQY